MPRKSWHPGSKCVYDDDPERHFAKGGVIEALDEAKKAGKVRYVGFTGHKRPAIHLKMLSYDYPFDSVQMPLNPFDATYHSFETSVLPEVSRRGMAALGMKSLGGNGQPVLKGVVTVEEALRYAMSLPVATTVSGIDSLAVLRQNLAVARGFQPMATAEMEALRRRCAGRRRRPLGDVQVHDEVRRRPGPGAARPPAPQGTAAVDRDGGRIDQPQVPCPFQPPDLVLVPFHDHPPRLSCAEGPDYITPATKKVTYQPEARARVR